MRMQTITNRDSFSNINKRIAKGSGKFCYKVSYRAIIWSNPNNPLS